MIPRMVRMLGVNTPAKVPKAERKLAETLGLYTERLYRFFDERGEELTEAQRDRLLAEILKLVTRHLHDAAVEHGFADHVVGQVG